jgi:hypothetical protein
MAKHVWELPINEDTTEEDLHRCIFEAVHSSDPNIVRAAARAQTELSLREREEWIARFNAESAERVKSQEFQAAQMEKQIKVATIQARAAWAAVVVTAIIAVATIALAVFSYLEHIAGAAVAAS